MIKRYFTVDVSDVTDTVNWVPRDINIRNADGETIYENSDCLFPEEFSQTACDVIASKYFYRGVDEKSYLDVIKRMTYFWGKALFEEGVLDEKECNIFTDEVLYMLLHQMWAPNSPQWFNTGIMDYYEVDDTDSDESCCQDDLNRELNHWYEAEPDDMYYYDSSGLHKSEDRYTRSQSSACFILDIEDKLIGRGSISDHYVTETKLFKGGSGCGTNFSPLRAKGERLSSGGTSSGLMSYLVGLDANAGAIKSGGTTRRAAKMVIVDADHPEIEDFIDWKVKEERKARVLIAAGYDGSIGGEAYSTVAGQNSNNTIRVNDKFMYAVMTDTNWKLRGRVDGSADREVSAKDLFRKIAEAAWECGDPGIQFSDHVERCNTCGKSGEIRSSNPCGEFLFLDNTACNLSSINLERFITDDKEADIEGIRQATILAQLVMEASVYKGQYPTPEIAENSYKFRPTGLGVTGLAGMLEAFGMPYDSRRAEVLAAGLMSFITSQSYLVSSWMGSKVGSFEMFAENRECMENVIRTHAIELNSLLFEDVEDIFYAAADNWDELEDQLDMFKFTPRNAQVTCIAPTGTISLAMDASSTGIEPYYSRKVSKKLADGSVIETQIKAIKTADEISPVDHVRMVAKIQPHISGGISKTVNLPENATVDDVGRVFYNAWMMGCKSITVYRDGSKSTQVLSSNTVNDTGNNTGNNTEKAPAPVKAEEGLVRKKPEGMRNSRTHSAKIGDIQLYITVGYYENGEVAEIFVNTNKQGEIVNGLLDGLSKTLSHLIQYGVDLEDISKILRGQRFEPAGIVERHPYIKFSDSISDLISRVIDFERGDYTRINISPVKDESTIYNPRRISETGERIYGEKCTNCGSSRLVRTGSCKTCIDCGTTTGCA